MPRATGSPGATSSSAARSPAARSRERWPCRPSYANARMRAQARVVWRELAPSFRAPAGPRKAGCYEAKGLLGLARFYRSVDPSGLARVRHGLRWIADVEAAWQPTGILGECWFVRDGGRMISVPSQPHIWEQCLFYLASVEAWGGDRYRAGKPGTLLRPR